jgi:hypothetical protein
MKDFNNIEDYPIPEGLEFNESYMQDAFALYDAEKQKRKRRLLIWWIVSSTGFAAVLLIGIYFFTKDIPSDAGNIQSITENTISLKPKANTKTNSTSTTKDSGNRNQSVETTAIKKPLNDSKTIKSIEESKNNAVSGNSESVERSQTKSRFTKRSKNKKGSNKGRPVLSYPSSTQLNPGSTVAGAVTIEEAEETTMWNPDDNRNELAETTTHHALSQQDLASLPVKPAYLAFARDSAHNLPPMPTYPLQAADTDFRKHQVYFNLGVNTLFGMKELQNRATFRESIGVSYHYQINPRFTIGAGLEYHSISRISYKRTVGDTTDSDNTTTILNKTTLNYISLSPQMSFQLVPKHRLTAGLGVEYLLKDPGERYEIQNYTSEENSRTNSKLYYSTFNRFNFSASLGYSFQFSRYMSAHALYHFGFTDITKNNSFNKTFDRNSRLQLVLKIRLY